MTTSTVETTPSSSDLSSIQSALPQLTVPGWAWLVVALAVFSIYLVSTENGALLGSAATTLHEFFHDGRHLASVPCH